MRFINLARGTEIGANSYYLELDGKKLILDAGLHPKQVGEAALPLYRLVPENGVDAILITHAHQDHVGSLPVLMRKQPDVPVFLTGATARLTEVMLHNSVNVMMRQREALGISGYPMFTHREIDRVVEHWQPVGFRQHWTLGGEKVPGPGQDLTIEMFEAGHILGAAGILLHGREKRIFYSGDVHFLDQTLVRAAQFPEEEVDVLILETTRGDRDIDPGFQRQKEEMRFLEAIEDAFARGGSVLVPVFALGKTQELLTMLFSFRRNGALRKTPLYIGGLSTKVTMVHDALAGTAPRQHPGLQLLDTLAPYILSSHEVGSTQINGQRLYALSSGMMTEKTLSNQLATRFLSDPKQSIFFVGYADPDSPGGRIKQSKKGDLIQLDAAAPSQKIACRVEEFDFSAHAPRHLLLDYVRRTRPKTVILVHGDPPAVSWFRESIERELPGTRVIIPESGQVYEL